MLYYSQLEVEMKLEWKCETCGSVFFRYAGNRNRFCSHRCHGISMRGMKWPRELVLQRAKKRTGQKFSEESKLRSSLAQIKSWREGRKHTTKTIEALIVRNKTLPKTKKWYTSMAKTGGANHYRWNGGRMRTMQGYVMLHRPNHPHAVKPNGYVMEHRLVMEQHIGRFLTPKETVHHLNHVKDDNRIENLFLFPSRGTHMRHHLPHGPISNINPNNSSIQRECRTCKTVYPLTTQHYYRAKNEIGGFEYKCKDCVYKYKHTRRQQKKAYPPQ